MLDLITDQVTRSPLKGEHFNLDSEDSSPFFLCKSYRKLFPCELLMVAQPGLCIAQVGLINTLKCFKAIIISDTYKQSVSASDPRGSDIPHVLCLASKLAVTALLCFAKISRVTTNGIAQMVMWLYTCPCEISKSYRPRYTNIYLTQPPPLHIFQPLLVCSIQLAFCL